MINSKILCKSGLRNLGSVKMVYTQSDSTGGSTDLIPRRILKLAHQGRHRAGIGNESVPKIIITNTTYLFFKLLSAFC